MIQAHRTEGCAPLRLSLDPFRVADALRDPRADAHEPVLGHGDAGAVSWLDLVLALVVVHQPVALANDAGTTVGPSAFAEGAAAPTNQHACLHLPTAQSTRAASNLWQESKAWHPYLAEVTWMLCRLRRLRFAATASLEEDWLRVLRHTTTREIRRCRF